MEKKIFDNRPQEVEAPGRYLKETFKGPQKKNLRIIERIFRRSSEGILQGISEIFSKELVELKLLWDLYPSIFHDF